jgi:hypothetical protein
MCATLPPPPVAIDPREHMTWARGIARAIARLYQFQPGGEESAELVAVAFLTLVARAKVFDARRVPPGGDVAAAFRGYCHREIQSECRREGKRLRAGGLIRRAIRPNQSPRIALPTSDFTDPFTHDAFDVEDHRGGLPDLDPPPKRWSPYCTCVSECCRCDELTAA